MRLHAHLSTAPWHRRGLIYLIGLTVVGMLSWGLGGLLADTDCTDHAVDCDLGGLVTAGVVVMAVLGYLLGVVLFELFLAVRRRRLRRAGDR